MNRKIGLTKSAVDRTIGAIRLALGSKEKKLLEEHKAKVYVMFDGTTLEGWWIDLAMEGDVQDEKTAGIGKSDSEGDARSDSQHDREVPCEESTRE